MIKLPISETALKFYEETGYRFSIKEQAHLCYRYTQGLLERNDILREILKESDDKELNEDINMLIEYGSNIYNIFMDNKDNKCIYFLRPLMDDYQPDVMFRTAWEAMDYAGDYIYTDYKIDKIRLYDDSSEDDSIFMSALTFKRGEGSDSIVGYRSIEYEDNYDPDEHGPFEERFDNMFMNVDLPFDLGDIVVVPETYYPAIVLCDKNIFHDRYETARSLDWDNIIMELDHEDNLIPVLDYLHDFSIKYVRPFDLEKANPRGHFSEGFCDKSFYMSRMIKSKFNMDKIKSCTSYR